MIERDLGEVVLVEAAHRRGRRAEPNARGDHRRPLVERDGVAVRGQLALLEPLLRRQARPLGRAQVELDEVRVGAAGEHVEAPASRPAASVSALARICRW